MTSEHPAGHEVIGVEVPGGRLAVETHPPGTEPVLAIHGVSSQPGCGTGCGPPTPASAWSRLARLDREWPSVRDYAEFFVAQTAPLLAHDLDGRRVRLSAEALIADAADIFFGTSKWQQLQVPARLLTAEWGTGPGSTPAYPAAAVAGFRDVFGELLTVRPVAGVDHAASIMTMTGARATAELIAEARS